MSEIKYNCCICQAELDDETSKDMCELCYNELYIPMREDSI